MPPLSKGARKSMEQIRANWIIPKKKTANLAIAAHVLGSTGKLRAGINVSNYLLVSKFENGVPHGVAPDLARAFGKKLGLEVELVPYANPGQLADDATKNKWDVGLIGAEPQRETTIAFSSPYALIPACYLVKPNSRIKTLLDVDHPGVRIAVSSRAAYELWLSDNLKDATLVKTVTPGLEQSWELFSKDPAVDCLAGLRPWLLDKVGMLPGSKILPGTFTMVNQAIGIPRSLGKGTDSRDVREVFAAVTEFVTDSKTSGLIEKLLRLHNVFGPRGLIVSP